MNQIPWKGRGKWTRKFCDSKILQGNKIWPYGILLHFYISLLLLGKRETKLCKIGENILEVGADEQFYLNWCIYTHSYWKNFYHNYSVFSIYIPRKYFFLLSPSAEFMIFTWLYTWFFSIVVGYCLKLNTSMDSTIISNLWHII